MNEDVPVDVPEDVPVDTPVDVPVENVVDPVSPLAYQESQFEGGFMTDAIRSMIGTPPAGFEFVEYALAGAIFIILFAIVASVFVGFSKMFGAR